MAEIQLHQAGAAGRPQVSELPYADLVIGAGGLGGLSAANVRAINRQAGSPLRLQTVSIDTDAQELADCDQRISLAPTSAEVDVLRRNAVAFGSRMERAIDRLGPMFSPGQAGVGARTTRLLGQVFVWAFYPRIVAGLQQAVRQLETLAGAASKIRVTIIASTGGGMGSSSGPILAANFARRSLREKLLPAGDISRFQTPELVAIEPYCHLVSGDRQAKLDKLQANMAAYDQETELLARAALVERVWHVAYTNHHGIKLDTKEKAALAAASLTFDLLRLGGTIAGRLTDDPDTGREAYRGVDLRRPSRRGARG